MEKEAFEYKRILQLKKMSLEELNSYYRMLRRYEFSIDKPLESSELKKRIHALTMLILKIDKLLTGRKVEIFDDKRTGTLSKGKVYASSHVGRYDIESAMEAINEQAYFVMGDPGETYRNFEGFFLENIHGRICVDTGYQVFDLIMRQKNGYQISEEEKSIIEEYKNDRRICEAICTKRIEKKDNILIYPEGAWNITDRLMQPLFNGAARIAINGNGVLVPIGIIRENKRYIVNIGNYFNVEGMLPFENKVAEYIEKNNNNHVLYRVTPIFKENNLVANGVQMEAESVEDKGEKVKFNVYAFNVQPNIKIDYLTGNSELIE